MDMAIRIAPGRGPRRSWARSLDDPNWRVLAGFTFAAIAVLLSGGRAMPCVAAAPLASIFHTPSSNWGLTRTRRTRSVSLT